MIQNEVSNKVNIFHFFFKISNSCIIALLHYCVVGWLKANKNLKVIHYLGERENNLKAKVSKNDGGRKLSERLTSLSSTEIT